MHLSDYACEYCRDDAMRGGSKMSQQIATACGHGSYATQGSMWCVQCGAERDECVLCGAALSGHDSTSPVEDVPKQEVVEPQEDFVDAEFKPGSSTESDEVSGNDQLADFEESLDDIAEDAFKEREAIDPELSIDEVREMYPVIPPDSTDGKVRWYHGGKRRSDHPSHSGSRRQRIMDFLRLVKKRFWRKPQVEWKIAFIALVLAILLFVWTHSQ